MKRQIFIENGTVNLGENKRYGVVKESEGLFGSIIYDDGSYQILLEGAKNLLTLGMLDSGSDSEVQAILFFIDNGYNVYEFDTHRELLLWRPLQKNKPPEDHKILDAMEKFGGSFASSLAKTAKLADSENYERLKSAFSELWDQYALFVDKNNENY